MRIGSTIVAGLLLLAAFFCGFGFWAALAPLESAAIASGIIGVDGRRKTVQHLEGGIVAEILVDEGSVVAAGDPLVRLDDTQTRATLERLRAQLYAAAAVKARLITERDALDQIDFPSWLQDEAARDSEVAGTLAGQQRIFAAQRQTLASRSAILRQRIAQLHEEIAGLEAEIGAQDEQRKLIAEEIIGVRGLLAKGLERKPRLLELQRRAAEIDGARAQNRARIARAEQAIGEAKLEIEDLSTEHLHEVVRELGELETVLNDLRERIGAAEDVLRRTEVIAPVSGTVVDLRLFTTGGVIGPGDPILDLVPSEEALLVEAYVDPNDIDVVHPGLSAQVRLTAFNYRTTPTFSGIVHQVSADRLTNEQTGQAYYLARVALDEEASHSELYPGMPAEVMIVTGERTMLEYLLKPITATLHRALREQ
jgi:HlyD family type I secretion membrane fusion protein